MLVSTIPPPPRFEKENEVKYAVDISELVSPERNTITVSFKDIESYNRNLATTIQDEYYRYKLEGGKTAVIVLGHVVFCR